MCQVMAELTEEWQFCLYISREMYQSCKYWYTSKFWSSVYDGHEGCKLIYIMWWKIFFHVHMFLVLLPVLRYIFDSIIYYVSVMHFCITVSLHSLWSKYCRILWILECTQFPALIFRLISVWLYVNTVAFYPWLRWNLKKPLARSTSLVASLIVLSSYAEKGKLFLFCWLKTTLELQQLWAIV